MRYVLPVKCPDLECLSEQLDEFLFVTTSQNRLPDQAAEHV